MPKAPVSVKRGNTKLRRLKAGGWLARESATFGKQLHSGRQRPQRWGSEDRVTRLTSKPASLIMQLQANEGHFVKSQGGWYEGHDLRVSSGFHTPTDRNHTHSKQTWSWGLAGWPTQLPPRLRSRPSSTSTSSMICWPLGRVGPTDPQLRISRPKSNNTVSERSLSEDPAMTE